MVLLVSGWGSAVLPEPALEAALAFEGDLVEGGHVVGAHGPAEGAGVVLGLAAVLGAGDGHGALGDDPVEGDLAGGLAAVGVADAAQLGDDGVDLLHRVG